MLSEVYFRSDPTYGGRYSVPVLFDKQVRAGAPVLDADRADRVDCLQRLGTDHAHALDRL